MAELESLSDDERTALLREFKRGADLIFGNAEQLFHEAEALKKNGSLARSLFLHQISIEECAKIEMIGAWATSLLMGKGIDLETVASGFRSHKAKNHTNAYMARLTEEELEARKHGDWKESVAAFKRFQDRFHQELNSAKNASLYVDFKEAKFSAPSEVVTEEVLKMFWGLNHYFLQVSFPYLSLLQKIENDNGPLQRVVKLFTERADEFTQKMLNEPDNAMDVLLKEMLKLYGEGGHNNAPPV